MRICDFTVPELDRFRKNCNFTECELRCFELKAKDCTNTQIALDLNISESTVAVTMKYVQHLYNTRVKKGPCTTHVQHKKSERILINPKENK